MNKKGVAVEIENLSIKLNSTEILKDISLKIDKGSIHCLIGPNGGGKSTLLKAILGLLDYEGDIKLRYEENKVIGYVPQKIDFDRNLPITVLDFLLLIYQSKPTFLGFENNLKSEIEKILLKIDMYEKKDRLLGTLSGGELQRLLFAQALYPKPNLLLLDEPFNGIDTVCETYFLNLIEELKKEGITIVWIHHNIKQIVGIADKVTCIKKTVMFSGKPEDELIENRIFEIFS